MFKVQGCNKHEQKGRKKDQVLSQCTGHYCAGPSCIHLYSNTAKSTQTANKGVKEQEATVITQKSEQEASPSHFLEYKTMTTSGPRYCSMQT